MRLKEITAESLEYMVPDRIFWRGEDLYSEGAVLNVSISENLITAEVEGNRLYAVQAAIMANDLIFSCSCPYEGLCKHSVALGLWIADNKSNLSDLIKRQEKKSAKPDVTDLVGKATRAQKDAFLIEALNESPTLLTRFEVMIKGTLNLEDDLDTDRLADDMRAHLQTFNLEDYSRFYDSAPEYYGYKEEWEVLRDGAESELNDLLDQYKFKALELLEIRDVIGAFKYVLALYEALNTADFTQVNDPACIFEEGLDMEGETYLDQLLEEFVSGFAEITFEEDVYVHLMDLFFHRYTAGVPDQVYRMADFSGLFLNCIVSEKTAGHMQRLLLNTEDLREEEYCEILLAVYEKQNETDKWLETAENYYRQNPAVTESLLNHFVHQKTKLVELAKNIAFKFNNEFIPFFYKNLEKEDDPGLYRKILAEHTRMQKTVVLYREYKHAYGIDAAKRFIDGLEGKWDMERFHIQLLKEEKAYEKMLILAEKNSKQEPAIARLRPLVDVYPDQVYKIISAHTETYLTNNTGRNYYRQAVEWLKLLKQIKDKTVSEKTSTFIHHLMGKYSNRSALKDELRKAGLV